MLARYLYNLLLHLALPLILLRLLWRSLRAPDYRKRVAERFSLCLPPLQTGGIWLHAVSLGESIAAAPLVEALLERYPHLPITLTCMTPTGSKRIGELFGERVQHCYLPYDLPWAARRFIRRVRPKLAILMETELWPNYIHQCVRLDIPVVLANGRMSERSYRGYARFAGLTYDMLSELRLLAVQTRIEDERFVALGALPERVHVTGSIKFDMPLPEGIAERALALRQDWKAQNRPLWIAASTHAGEDEIILSAHRAVLQTQRDTLLILVPRHPERFSAVYQLCQKQGFSVKRRSTLQAVAAQTQVLLGDTLGELLFLYALADFAFVGGSLVPHGGHNLLEPAALGKPLFCGPHCFNFAEISAQLERAGALQRVQDAQSLAAALTALWNNPAQAVCMQQIAQSVFKANQGALERLLKKLAPLL